MLDAAAVAGEYLDNRAAPRGYARSLLAFGSILSGKEACCASLIVSAILLLICWRQELVGGRPVTPTFAESAEPLRSTALGRVRPDLALTLTYIMGQCQRESETQRSIEYLNQAVFG